MADDLTPSTPPADPAGTSPGMPPIVGQPLSEGGSAGSVAGTPAKRKRRRRKKKGVSPQSAARIFSEGNNAPPLSRVIPTRHSPEFGSGRPLDQLAATDVNMVEEEAEEALDQPRASVQDMEEDDDDFSTEPEASDVQPAADRPTSSVFSVSMAPEEKKEPDDLVYEAPVYQAPSVVPPAAPAPSPAPSEFEDPFGPTQTDPFAPSPTPVPAPEAKPVSPAYDDPFGAYESPFGPTPTPTPPSPFVAPSNTPFAAAPGPAPAGPSSSDPFGPWPSSAPLIHDEPQRSAPASGVEPSPYDLAASFSSSPREPAPPPYEVGPSPFDQPLPEPAPFNPPRPALAEQVSEPLEGEVVEQESISEVSHEPRLEESGGLAERLRQVLAEANLTPRHLKFCCGGLLVALVIILSAVWFVPKLLNSNWLSDGSGQTEETDETTETDQIDEIVVEDEEEDVTHGVVSGGKVWVDSSVYNGLLIGESPSAAPSVEPSANTGLETGLLVGDVSSEDEATLSFFQQSVQELESLYNLYFVDIQGLLDGSEDRAEALDDHIQLLTDSYENGSETYTKLGEIQDQLKGEYDPGLESKEEAEAQFFVELDAFDGEAAETQLLTFVELKQELVDLKAKYMAFGELQSRFETVLDSLFPLIEDLRVNREALISGVQVVDVLDSDLDLILTQSDLEE